MADKRLIDPEFRYAGARGASTGSNHSGRSLNKMALCSRRADGVVLSMRRADLYHC